MATLKTSASVSRAEDYSAVLSKVAPEKTPFLTMIGSDKVSNTRADWQNEDLAAPSTANAQLEGFDAARVAAAATTKLGNIAQLFKKEGSVSKTNEAVTHKGINGLLAHDKVNKAIELKRDKEATYLSSQGSRLENGTDARLTGGVLSWIKSNIDAPAGSTLDGGYNSTTGLTADHSVIGTARALTIDMFANVQQKMFDNGNVAGVALMGSNQKRKFSDFAGIAANRAAVSGKEQATIYDGADIYVGDFGPITIVPHAYALRNEVLFLDKEFVKDGVLRGIETSELANTGDTTAYVMTHEAMLKVVNEKGLGVIRGLTA